MYREVKCDRLACFSLDEEIVSKRRAWKPRIVSMVASSSVCGAGGRGDRVFRLILPYRSGCQALSSALLALANEWNSMLKAESSFSMRIQLVHSRGGSPLQAILQQRKLIGDGGDSFRF